VRKVHVAIAVPAGGTVLITVDRTATGQTNAVLSGLFMAAAINPPPNPTPTPTRRPPDADAHPTPTPAPTPADADAPPTPTPTRPRLPRQPGPTPASPDRAGTPTGSARRPATSGHPRLVGARVEQRQRSWLPTRSTTSGAETLLTSVGTVLTYTDSAVTNGTTYFYKVSALNAAGEGPRSTEASAKPATVPTVPRSVVAAQNATKGVTLTWVAPSSNGGAGITGYRVYRGTTTGSQTFLIAIGNVTSYVDTATTSASATTTGCRP
jgi:hypothetical protein